MGLEHLERVSSPERVWKLFFEKAGKEDLELDHRWSQMLKLGSRKSPKIF